MKIKGFKLHAHGTRATLEHIANVGKLTGKFQKYRIVPSGKTFELHIRGKK
jgi:hypothetical protein